ncbi:hypothetical protein PIB30_037220 [Stylosanthes scabra]|uniref:Uncharacterized protein n=1 Tax=Stylosanthes scabra TaxID=79078 RepID=A0ABU6ZCE4_9FABA|nr:hypothetical protein [Stylosanthes scabra]
MTRRELRGVRVGLSMGPRQESRRNPESSGGGGRSSGGRIWRSGGQMRRRCVSLSRVSTPPTTKPHTANQTHAHTGHRPPPTTTAPTCPPSPSIGIVGARGSQSLTHAVTPEVHRQIRRRCLAVAPPPARAVIVACPLSLSNEAELSSPFCCSHSRQPTSNCHSSASHKSQRTSVAVLAAHVTSPPSSAVSMPVQP